MYNTILKSQQGNWNHIPCSIFSLVPIGKHKYLYPLTLHSPCWHFPGSGSMHSLGSLHTLIAVRSASPFLPWGIAAGSDVSCLGCLHVTKNFLTPCVLCGDGKRVRVCGIVSTLRIFWIANNFLFVTNIPESNCKDFSKQKPIVLRALIKLCSSLCESGLCNVQCWSYPLLFHTVLLPLYAKIFPASREGEE